MTAHTGGESRVGETAELSAHPRQQRNGAVSQTAPKWVGVIAARVGRAGSCGDICRICRTTAIPLWASADTGSRRCPDTANHSALDTKRRGSLDTSHYRGYFAIASCCPGVATGLDALDTNRFVDHFPVEA